MASVQEQKNKLKNKVSSSLQADTFVKTYRLFADGFVVIKGTNIHHQWKCVVPKPFRHAIYQLLLKSKLCITSAIPSYRICFKSFLYTMASYQSTQSRTFEINKNCKQNYYLLIREVNRLQLIYTFILLYNNFKLHLGTNQGLTEVSVRQFQVRKVKN